ncbi:hypothetical protein [Sphingomonas abietis]|uniref:Glycosyltransferase family 2 protein n=1 Tax=Sphingomonas abietis TaxID=3012344 RepID=A0ABY7NPF2_9SPHN|nr:hypothetical protein [Sphingomonas abietis]WBO22351.1 hypothetical protein PBT88_19795 [Sphingomonas abietis]
MIDRILRKGREALHLRAARAVLRTPPIVPTADRVVIFSMIGTRVLLPYLVAVKTLHARLRIGRIAILDDGSLTEADKAVLAHHCGDPAIRSIRDVDTGLCPQGGTWERLLTLLDLRADDYVIQLDSDTVTIGDVPDVLAAIADNRSFTLLGGPESEGVGLLPLPAFVAWRYPDGVPAGRPHIQAAIESHFGCYPDAAAHHYVRGCSGFTGFARGGVSGRSEAERFSCAGEALVGKERWSEWGTEQVASSFLLANEPGTQPLPYARYANYWKQAIGAETCFLHFVGTNRYADAEYRVRTRQAIAALG